MSQPPRALAASQPALIVVVLSPSTAPRTPAGTSVSDAIRAGRPTAFASV